MLYTGAAGAGLFQRAGDRLHLFASCSLAQADLDRAYGAWDDGADSIIAGHPYTDQGFALAPLGIEAEAVLYLGARRALRADMALVDELGPLLLASTREPGARRPPSVGELYT